MPADSACLRIRGQLEHPVVDGDAHFREDFPAFFQFRHFVFEDPVRFSASARPDLCEGKALEAEVRRIVASGKAADRRARARFQLRRSGAGGLDGGSIA